MGKHFANSSFGCLSAACVCAPLTWVEGKHCMQMAHLRSMLLVLFSSPDLPPPPWDAFAALAAFLARDIAVFCALPPPMAGKRGGDPRWWCRDPGGRLEPNQLE
eukprot:CAMPEP_0204598450 /NCGR_PEP_ID=MMETSP0661-20131031/54317_1 /ASSEMBLY_ACC=CAM_ASM_000606 /TAXON_ID=109239 /ORGANISM="Alexandrium margalefi, Strain AMGDE01CS-322" /LENGTH=103 /DNA_ID=CAMNT_0051609153 /DNA_START=108 /DNA_END=416 /DNA_ORIENTATION=-